MKILFVLPFLLVFQFSISQITLTHNVGSTPVNTDMTSCERDELWARAFTLSDFGISATQQFIIRSGEVAISNSYEGARIIFNVYGIDANFPATKPRVIGAGYLMYAPEIGDTPEIIHIDFSTPIVVPAGIERILVEVTQGEDIYNPDFKKVRIAGTEFDNDISWFKGCRQYYSHIPTENMSDPVYNANFFIRVSGEKMSILNEGDTVLLNPGTGDVPVQTRQYSCTGGGLKFAKTFVLQDLGVPGGQDYVIRRGQVALSRIGVSTARIQFNIYRIDSNFPDSLSDADLIGSSQVVRIPYFSNPPDPRIFNIDFESPVVVPAGTERILVEVYNLPCGGSSCHVFIAGIEQGSGLSWLKSESGGCPPFREYLSTDEMGHPEINYFIRTMGEVRTPFPFQLEIGNDCSAETFRTFDLDNKENIRSIMWDFGDPLSGAENTSADIQTSHTYTDNGEYLLSATILGMDGKEYKLEKILFVSGPPEIEQLQDLIACEDVPGTGIATSISTEGIHDLILAGRENLDVSYFDGNGSELASPLPLSLTNTIPEKETITVRVSYAHRPSCYSEASFDLHVKPLPVVQVVEDFVQCADGVEGFATFNLRNLKTTLILENPDTEISFYYEDNSEIVILETVRNKVAFEENIRLLSTNLLTGCTFETQFKLKVHPVPVAPVIPPFIGCDDNEDGISEYFDTTGLSSQLSGNQEAIIVSYFDVNGDWLYDTFPDRYTNTEPYEETITARLTNSITGCTAQTELTFRTSDKPQVLTPDPLYACDQGDGWAAFDTSLIEEQLIGDQKGLNIYYSDSAGNALPSPLPVLFSNTEAWGQIIYVKVENAINKSCATETTLKLVVQEIPAIQLENSYFLCNLEPSLHISVAQNLDSYEWRNGKGDMISENFYAEIVEEGNYKLTVGRLTNGIYCETTREFELVRSVLPMISEVRFQELSNSNRIEIEASGDGNFEYSMDGVAYQDSNRFENMPGGIYTVYVRDKNGCGEDFKEVTLLDYPRFFTPNNDGRNDFWHILGVQNYPECKIFIYDRYGKLIAQLDANSTGWDGEYLNSALPSTDYWFKAELGDGKEFDGHFTLKR